MIGWDGLFSVVVVDHEVRALHLYMVHHLRQDVVGIAAGRRCRDPGVVKILSPVLQHQLLLGLLELHSLIDLIHILHRTQHLLSPHIFDHAKVLVGPGVHIALLIFTELIPATHLEL